MTDKTDITPAGETLPATADRSPLAVMAEGVAAGTVPAEVAQVIQEMMHREQDRQARMAYYEALAAFQAECPTVVRHGTIEDGRGNVRSRFARLEDIAHEVAPLLREHGFAYRFETQWHESGGVTVRCIVTHRDGHSESSPVFMPPANIPGASDPQKQGATLTYATRRAFIAALGIMTADPDNDAAYAEPDPTPVTGSQAADLQALAEEVGADPARFLKWAGAETWEAIPAARFDRCVQALEEKRRQGQ